MGHISPTNERIDIQHMQKIYQPPPTNGDPNAENIFTLRKNSTVSTSVRQVRKTMESKEIPPTSKIKPSMKARQPNSP